MARLRGLCMDREVPGGGSSAEIVDDGTGQGIDETTGTTSGGGSGESEDQEEGLARRSEGSPEGVYQPAHGLVVGSTQPAGDVAVEALSSGPSG